MTTAKEKAAPQGTAKQDKPIITLPARECDQRAVEWLAEKDESGKFNFINVYEECNTFHAAHPNANIRVDRLYSMSNKSHDLWVTTQRLLICYDWRLADCIHPHASAADADWDNIFAYAQRYFPFSWHSDDWKFVYNQRRDFHLMQEWKLDKGGCSYTNGLGDTIRHADRDTYEITLGEGTVCGGITLRMYAPSAKDALFKAGREVFKYRREGEKELPL